MSPLERYEDFAPQVDPSAFVHGAAVVIGEVVIGPESSVWPGAVIRGDDGEIRVGARTSIQDGAVLHGTEGQSITVIGDQVTVGHRAVVHGARVADNVIVGMGAIVMDNAEIGEWSLIGAGALITARKAFPPRSMILGSPAKVVRELTDAELEWITYSWTNYAEKCRRYRGAQQG